MEKELVERDSDGSTVGASYGGIKDSNDDTPVDTPTAQDPDQTRLWNAAYYIGWVSFIVLLILGVLSIALGKAYDRASVFAFGFSALLDGACAGIVVWRSFSMRNGPQMSHDKSLIKELVADFMLGVIFIAAAVVILTNSIKGLYQPFLSADKVLLIVSGLGGGVEIVFCVLKIYLGKKLRSVSVLADGINSLVCGLLGLIVIPSVIVGQETHNGSADHILGIIVGVFICLYGLFLLYHVFSNHVTRTWIRNNVGQLLHKGSPLSGSSESPSSG